MSCNKKCQLNPRSLPRPERRDCVAGHVRFEVRRETGKE